MMGYALLLRNCDRAVQRYIKCVQYRQLYWAQQRKEKMVEIEKEGGRWGTEMRKVWNNEIK